MNEGLLFYIISMLSTHNLALGTIQLHISAVGIFAGQINCPHPALLLVSVLLQVQCNEHKQPKDKAHGHHFSVVVALTHIIFTLADHESQHGMSWLQFAHLVIAMLQFVWLHCPHSAMSARAKTSYLTDTQYLFFGPLEQKHKTSTRLIWVQLLPNWAEFIADWFVIGSPMLYLFSLMDEIPAPAVFNSVFYSSSSLNPTISTI